MRERTDVYGCTGIGGGDSVHSGLLCIVLQRFATLVWFVVGGFGKGYTRQKQARRYIAKMKIKGLNIILIKLSTVCYLTCDIFMFVYKLYR